MQSIRGGNKGQYINRRWECIGYSEIDKYAITTYEKHFKHKNYGDAKYIDWNSVPDFDMLCGGFPCQAFSLAGRRKGFDDTRGTLFFEICKGIENKKPQYIFLENVKGLLNHEDGKTFRTILQKIDELGYDAEWQILNSKHFGVPQNRERVFIIGHLRGKGFRQIFPITGTGKEPNKWAASLQHPGHSGGNYKGMNMIKELTGKRQGYRVYDPKGIMATTNSTPGGITKDNCIAVLTPDRLEKRQHGPRFKKNGEPSFTLTGQDIHGVMISKTVRIGGRGTLTKKHNWDSYQIGKRIRRLTPTECERLQGFPDGWTEGVSESQRYKQLGNAVTVNVIEAIVRQWINKIPI